MFKGIEPLTDHCFHEDRLAVIVFKPFFGLDRLETPYCLCFAYQRQHIVFKFYKETSECWHYSNIIWDFSYTLYFSPRTYHLKDRGCEGSSFSYKEPIQMHMERMAVTCHLILILAPNRQAYNLQFF